MDTPSCGRDEDDGVPKPSSLLLNGPCHRCQSPKSYTVSRQRRLCKQCFVLVAVSLVKKALSPVRMRSKKDRTAIMMGWNGGMGCNALLSLLWRLSSVEDQRSRVWDVTVVWVDCTQVLFQSGDERQCCASAQALCESMGARWESVGLHSFFSAIHEEQQQREMVGRVFLNGDDASSAVSADVTWKEELLDHMIRTLLIRRASALGIHRIVTCETMTRACVKLLSSISRGVGSTAGLQVAEVDAATLAEDNLIWVKPLVAMSSKEAALVYRALQGTNIRVLQSFLLGGRSNPLRSSRALSEVFLNRLEAGHAHSLYALLGTAGKLEMPKHRAQEWWQCSGGFLEEKSHPVVDVIPPGPRCALCKIVREPAKLEHQQESGKCESDSSCCGSSNGTDCCSSSSTRVGPTPFLCRACVKVTAVLQERSGLTLNEWTVSSSGPSTKREQLRERIADCLLSDNEEDE